MRGFTLESKRKTTLIPNYHFYYQTWQSKNCFLKHIPDCLGCDRVGHGVVDKVGGLNSIIKPFSDDLMDNRLFVARRKLRKNGPLCHFSCPHPFPS
jgi:hypothetical protein